MSGADTQTPRTVDELLAIERPNQVDALELQIALARQTLALERATAAARSTTDRPPATGPSLKPRWLDAALCSLAIVTFGVLGSFVHDHFLVGMFLVPFIPPAMQRAGWPGASVCAVAIVIFSALGANIHYLWLWGTFLSPFGLPLAHRLWARNASAGAARPAAPKSRQ